jgi:hypothetical protein
MVFLSDGSSKTLQKTFYKKIVSKSFYKKFDQNSKTDFFSFFFYHVFGRFSARGVQKHDKKNTDKTNLTPSYPFFVLWRSDPPTHHGGPRARGASKKKEKENKHENKNLAKSDRPTFPLFFFFFFFF